MSISRILTVIDEYKNLSIECALEKNVLIVRELVKAKDLKLKEIMILIRILQKDAVINELNNFINNLQE